VGQENCNYDGSYCLDREHPRSSRELVNLLIAEESLVVLRKKGWQAVLGDIGKRYCTTNKAK